VKLRAAAIVVAAAAIAAPLRAQSSRPPLEAWRIGAEVMAGAYAGYAGYYLGRYVGTRVGERMFSSSTPDGVRIAVRQSLGYLAAGAATAGAVYGVGSIQNQTASFGATVLGTGAGFALAMGVNRLLWPPARAGESSGSKLTRSAAEVVQVLLPSLGASIGFNSTRKTR
jgi:hypothetical protein